MVNRFKTFLEEKTTRRRIRVVAFGALGVVVGAFLMLQYQGLPSRNVPTEQVSVGDIDPITKTAYTLPEANPVSISIPSIGVETTFENPLGLNPDRTVEVPGSYEKVGWYQYGPTPGELGPAVVLGHVDSKAGPAVFFSLGKLKVGDPIEIMRDDGLIATFYVTALNRYEQKGFPRELVYGDIDYAGLRLVTCSGIYERGKQRYTHNLVVYAALKEPEEESEGESENKDDVTPPTDT